MHYTQVIQGRFLERPNRFIAKVQLPHQKEVEICHVKNTGRCQELLVPGCTVFLSVSDNPKRKTRCDLIAVEKPGVGLVNIDSQAPNQIVKEWLETKPPLFSGLTELQPETVCGASRFDFSFTLNHQRCWMEVKGVTLEKEGQAYFPDAPTQRGTKHLKELAQLALEGHPAWLAFVIQMENCNTVLPCTEIDPAFSQALADAKKAGVHVLYLGCTVKKDELYISRVHQEEESKK